MRLLAFAAIGFASLATACADPDVETSADYDLTQTATLRFKATDGEISLTVSGKKHSCVERFEGVDGERLTCTRDADEVEVLVKASGDRVMAVRNAGGERGYYDCQVGEDRVEGLPALMKCKQTGIGISDNGGLSSPFLSSVDGIGVPNTHWLDEEAGVLRGMEPRKAEQYDELRAAGVERVLIFKNATNSGVEQEIATWDLPEGDLLHVPFHWKDYEDFTTPCEQTVEALRFMREGVEAERMTYFHCTVGEDRTGYLAALYSLLFRGADARRAFELDMCEHGYADGNPQKPSFVIGKLRQGLTPLYREMAYLVREGLLTEELDASVCADEPEVAEDFLAETLSCGTSTTLLPSP